MILYSMNNETNILEFVSFCVEMYAMKKHISGADAMKIFIDNDIVTYLKSNYEVLHTQGENYIIPLLSERIEKV